MFLVNNDHDLYLKLCFVSFDNNNILFQTVIISLSYYLENNFSFSYITSQFLWLSIRILSFCNFRLNNIWFENRCKIYLIILTIFSVMSFYIFENGETNIRNNGILMSNNVSTIRRFDGKIQTLYVQYINIAK